MNFESVGDGAVFSLACVLDTHLVLTERTAAGVGKADDRARDIAASGGHASRAVADGEVCLDMFVFPSDIEVITERTPDQTKVERSGLFKVI